MSLVIQFIGALLIVVGIFFTVTGAIGLIRLPDLYSRLHAASVTDTMGVGMVFLGLILNAGFNMISIKLALIVIFIQFSSPVATHALAKAALHGRLEPWRKPAPEKLP